MKMKKWWFLIIVAAALLAVGIFSRNGEKKSAAVAGKVVVMINNGPKETNKVAVQRLKEDIARFNKIYPDIEIRWTDRPYSPDSFATSMAGGTAEDVISLWATEGYVVERGYALDLTEMLNDWQEKAQINKDVLAPFVRDGRVYALPTDGYLMGLIYNKKLFRQAGLLDGDGNAEVPANWDEFVAVAKKLTDKKGGVSGFGIMGRQAEILSWRGAAFGRRFSLKKRR
jgi:ABC-type glycerol-3-phosphate transport system substrate-binding protein